MSESKQKKNHLFKGDWKAYSMWREEAEGKEKSRLRGQMKNAGHKKEPTNTMYPSLPEESKSHNPFCGVDPDLDSAPPPPYTPPLNQDEAGKQKSHQHHHQPLLQHPSTRRKRTQMKGSEKSMENGQAAHRERLISFDKPITWRVVKTGPKRKKKKGPMNQPKPSCQWWKQRDLMAPSWCSVHGQTETLRRQCCMFALPLIIWQSLKVTDRKWLDSVCKRI